ncbi:hypothetical protein ABTY98_17630 [Streptomyces sp. NPDC096040]|uniref:hypothetical protein n=1 Tax=Streptomyces sp. NPDC096040 TaxID=3155541 RepID=UPI00332D36D7
MGRRTARRPGTDGGRSDAEELHERESPGHSGLALAGTHLGMLTRLGQVRTRRIRHRTYYRRDGTRIAEVARISEKGW